MSNSENIQNIAESMTVVLNQTDAIVDLARALKTTAPDTALAIVRISEVQILALKQLNNDILRTLTELA